MRYLALILTLSVVCADDFDIVKSFRKCYDNFQNNIFKSDMKQEWQKYCLDNNPYVRQRFNGWVNKIPNIHEYSNSGNLPKPMISKRARKEYRMLTTKERHDFNRAINLLKQDTSLAPNVYDAIAFLHSGSTVRNAHAGPAFLAWHRIYLHIMEEALNKKVPGITIPYWDPTLDSSLDNPRDSILWTDEFLGNINGIVNCGAFANWSTPAGPLIRNGGFISNLPTTDDIKNILSRWRLADITEPNAIGKYNLEFHHNSIHNFIGGHLGQPETSSMDPVFWLIHSYIDLLMTRFNENQKKHNVDPAADYPLNYGLPIYAPDQNIVLKNITIREALRQTQSYEYVPLYDYTILEMPCYENSGFLPSPYLTCHNGRYQTKTRESTGCNSLIPYQNMFCINRNCDLKEWAFIPVEIIYERPFETMKFGNFPIKNGIPDLLTDLYDNNLPQNISSTNSTCRRKKCCGSAGRLNIQASGINYFGNYEEMVIVDRRLAVSSDIAYIGIRRPATNYSLTFTTVSEPCGRICRPSCLVPGSNPPRYTECIGLLNLTHNDAHLYGKTLSEAYMKVWDYKNQIRPKVRHENIPIVFHCDDSLWPFNLTSYTTTTPSSWTTASTRTRTTTTTTTTTTTPTPTTTTPTTTTPTTTTPTTTTPTTTTRWVWKTKTTTPTRWEWKTTTPSGDSNIFCKVDDTCIIPARCSCTYMERKPCMQLCSRYAICIYGQYYVLSCGSGFRYNHQLKRCVRGYCSHRYLSKI